MKENKKREFILIGILGILIILITVFFISINSSAEGNDFTGKAINIKQKIVKPLCTDTDMKAIDERYQKGTITFIEAAKQGQRAQKKTVSDNCKDQNTLLEYSCRSPNKIKEIFCQYGCNEGACNLPPSSKQISLLDNDKDGINNKNDNCINIPNQDQADLDDDGVGDLCDCTQSSCTKMCFSFKEKSYIECEKAQKNDFCDSNILYPINGYLLDSVWNGNKCVQCSKKETICNDNLDNDCDGLIDVEEPDCLEIGQVQHSDWFQSCGGALAPINFGFYENSCTDQKDNDGDGHTDCFDTDCVYSNQCLKLSPEDCSCIDINGDGKIYQDWHDLAIAYNTKDYDKVYKCTQIYKPYCLDQEVKTFIDWIREKGFAGVIINKYALDANDDSKRYSGTATNFANYFMHKANTFNDDLKEFRKPEPFKIIFIEVVPTDIDIKSIEPLTEEYKAEFEPILEKVYAKDFEISFQKEEINFKQIFGNSILCKNKFGNDKVCFDYEKMLDWEQEITNNGNLKVFIQFNVDDKYAQINDDGKVFELGSNKYALFLIRGDKTPLLWAHELGHALSLNHPIAIQTEPEENINQLIGVGSIMATQGYVYKTSSQLGPLEMYQLEPENGFKDEAQFVKTYNDFYSSGSCQEPECNSDKKIVINNEALKFALLKSFKLIDTNLNGEFDQCEVLNYENTNSLSLMKSNIKDIDDLNYFINVGYLNLNDNQIENISILPNLKKLSSLFLFHNNIKELVALNSIPNLEIVDVRSNPIAINKENCTTLNKLKNKIVVQIDEEILNQCQDLE